MKLSIVMPAHNEEGCIENTINGIHSLFIKEEIPHEILVINDNSTDKTLKILKRLSENNTRIRFINNAPPNGFGFAVRKGLENFDGDAVAIVMADGSDLPEDILQYYHRIRQGYECVFGTRWSMGGKTIDYPIHKYILNRLANWFIMVLFGLRYNDVTNAFKMYRTNVIQGLKPFLSHHFNLTVEMPLKAIIRGYSYCVVPNTWINRKAGVSKLKIREMGSRYLFIIIYCFIEKWLSRGDYMRKSGCQNNVVANTANNSESI
jgi:dolichol-phosphate mannosyltransferase